MNNTGFVRARQCSTHLRHDAGCLFERKTPDAFQTVREAFASEHLHHYERNVAVDTVVENLHHVGAPELCRSTRLANKSLAGLFILSDRRINQLHGNVGSERQVLRFPNAAHPSLTEK